MPPATALASPSPPRRAAPAPRAAAGPARAFAFVEAIDRIEAAREALGRNRRPRVGEPVSGFRIRPHLVGDHRRRAARRADDRRRARRSGRGRRAAAARAVFATGRCGSPPSSAARTPISTWACSGRASPGRVRKSRRCSPPPRGSARRASTRSCSSTSPASGRERPIRWPPRRTSRARASPTRARCPADFAIWRDAHASKDAQKKLRKKAKRLEAMGPLAHRRAADSAEVERVLAAFDAQRRARMRALGVADAYESAEARAFLRAPRPLRPRRGRAAPGAPCALPRRSDRRDLRRVERRRPAQRSVSLLRLRSRNRAQQSGRTHRPRHGARGDRARPQDLRSRRRRGALQGRRVRGRRRAVRQRLRRHPARPASRRSRSRPNSAPSGGSNARRGSSPSPGGCARRRGDEADARRPRVGRAFPPIARAAASVDLLRRAAIPRDFTPTSRSGGG